MLREQSSALERQLAAQRELLRTTESILTTLDQRAVLEQITDRLGALIQCDNIAIEVVDRAAGLLRPADRARRPRGRLHAVVGAGRDRHRDVGRRAQRARPDRGRATDERVNHFRVTGAIDGSLIVVPLLGPDGAAGVLTLERLGDATGFDEQEFELVKLFAAQVSIALRNAEIFQAGRVRARGPTT